MSDEFRVRIGRVIRKGGADLKVIEGKFARADMPSECRSKMETSTDAILEHIPDLAGFVVIGWDMQARFCLGFRNTLGSVPHRLLPTFVRDVLRDEMVLGDVRSEMREGQWQ